jgi:glutaredoxin
MKLIRLILGKLILFFDQLTTPESVVRSEGEQAGIDHATRSLTLYEMETCPFCIKVRRQITRLGLKIERRDIKESAAALNELLAGGGQDQVPCLKITKADGKFQWLYESTDINSWLRSEYSHSQSLA